METELNGAESPEIIDVRTSAEYKAVHADGAKNIPLDTLDPAQVMSGRDQAKPLYVICKAGGRGEKACHAFINAGFENVVNIAGGTDAWVSKGLPAQKSEGGVISIERQVRITAGILIVMGVALGFTLNSNFFFLSGIVGAGFIFAGITDSCAMGLMLAKMPWNKA